MGAWNMRVTFLALLGAFLAAGARAERPYEFRRHLACVHEKDFVDRSQVRATDEYVISEGATVALPNGAGEVLLTAARDFVDYLFTSMAVSARVTSGTAGSLAVTLDPSLRAREYEIGVSGSGIRIRARDERAAAQALYRLEDRMNLRRAPFLRQGTERRRMKYSPRMVHSGWAVDVFPDAYLKRLAHAGYDAILVFVKDIGVTQGEGDRADIPDLIRRARTHGIDVYLYSKLRAFAHPADPGSKDVFSNTYGRLAAAYPDAKGIVFVGESCEFPSKDPRTTGRSYLDPRADGDTRPDPAWFPCCDYPDWMKAVRDAVKAESPSMEIVFWTYNWGRATVEERCEVLSRFPEDVVLNLTCHAGGCAEHRNGWRNACNDYTISVPGLAPCARGEAAFAKSGGRRFYLMCNTGGLTWDFGCIPFEPFPFQWKRRWDALESCRIKNGLAGLMESHHFGWYPNFISELAKEAFTEGGMPFDEHLRLLVVRDYGVRRAADVIDVWQRWSAAIADYPATNANQYGPFRIGPAYPFVFGGPNVAPLLADKPASGDAFRFPIPPQATHSLAWMCNLNYDGTHGDVPQDPDCPPDLGKELELLESMEREFDAGADVLAESGSMRQATLGRYLARTVSTAIHVKRGHDAFVRGDRSALMEAARAEYENVRQALPLVEADSRLGWEPTMEYVGGPDAIRWKLATMERLYGFGEGPCDFSRVEADVSGLPEKMRLVGDLLAARISERTDPQGAAATLKVRYSIDASLGTDEASVRVKGRTAEICAPRLRGLLAGTGRLLKSLTYGARTFSAHDGSYDFKPAKSVRIAYLGRHFINPYMQLDADTLCRYLDDLALDGINLFNIQMELPCVDDARVTDEERATYEANSIRIGRRFADLDCELVCHGGSNQLPMDSPEEYRAAPNTNKKAPPTGFNACPAKPNALAALLAERRRTLSAQKKVSDLCGFRIFGFYNWPYDEGGCGCATCSPWGGNGYLKLDERLRDLNSDVFPGAKNIVSTWFFDDDDYNGLWKYLETHDWIDYLLVDDFGDRYPEFPLKHPVPNRKTKIITFPEISMWGRTPWGGYGAIALPKFLESLFRQSARISDGFMYYSEGLFEDINKAIVTGLYIDPSQSTDDILRQYAAYHFAGCDPEDFVKLANLMETNHRLTFLERDNAMAAVSLAEKIDREILPTLRTSWRWRIVWLRTMIDREIARTEKRAPESAQPYFDELVRIYHVERQLEWVLDGNLGGWTCPNYVPHGGSRALKPPAGDATEMLNRLIEKPMQMGVRLGPGKWSVGDLRIGRARFDLVLEDGCLLAGNSLQIRPGVNGVTVQGEGRATLDLAVRLTDATNVVIRNVYVPDGRVEISGCAAVRIDLTPERAFCRTGDPVADLKRLDREIEWADQHAERERVERMNEALKLIKSTACPGSEVQGHQGIKTR